MLRQYTSIREKNSTDSVIESLSSMIRYGECDKKIMQYNICPEVLGNTVGFTATMYKKGGDRF